MSDETEERTYTQAELNEARAAGEQAAMAFAAASIVGLRGELDALLMARAQGYREGLAVPGEAPVRYCGAAAPAVTLGEAPVYCQREPEHPLGPYDRHKAVFGEPHVAVVWNEP